MPKYGGVKSGFTLYGNMSNDTVYLIGQKAQPWNSVVALQSDSYETVSTTNYKSVPAAWTRPNTSAEANFVWRTAYASAPGSVAVNLQGAMDDVDGQYVTVDSSTSTAGETRIIASPFRFFRVIFTTAPSVGAIVSLGAA
jgi:hypothetical protein